MECNGVQLFRVSLTCWKWSGRRGSNPRRPAWEYALPLKIENLCVQRDQANQTLCFSSRPFVLCGLPVRRLPEGRLLYERRNGQFVLQVTGHPEYGVPFGQDRIVPIFLATLALQQKSQTIRFRSAAE